MISDQKMDTLKCFCSLLWLNLCQMINRKAKCNKAESSQSLPKHIQDENCWSQVVSLWSVSHAAGPDVSAVGSGNEKVHCVFDFVRMCVSQAGSERICVEIYVLRIYWATEPQCDIHQRDVSQWKSIAQTIINTAKAFCWRCSKMIHKMAQLPANRPLLHLSLTDHFARDRAVIDCVYVSRPLCDWWSEMCVCHSVDKWRIHSTPAAVLRCAGWAPLTRIWEQILSVLLNLKKKSKALLPL